MKGFGGRPRSRALLRRAVALSLVLLLVPALAQGTMLPEDKLEAAREFLFDGNYAEGERLLAEIIYELGRYPNDVASLIIVGKAYFYLEEDDRALNTFARALDLAPETAEAYFYSGLVHAYGGNLSQAVSFFATATEHAPDVAAYWLELGRSYSLAGFRDDALAAYDRTLELDPEHAEALYNSGVVLVGLGRLTEGLDRFLRTLVVASDYTDAAYNAGIVLNDMGRPEDARPHMERVVAHEPFNWEALETLIQIYQAINAYDERDQAIDQLYALRRTGQAADLAREPYFVRERFVHDDDLVVALQYFDMAGEMPRKYVFVIFNAATGQQIREISLGSYPFTKTIAKELGTEGADDLWHLDGYWPNGSHATYGFYIPEPTYDTVREAVLQVLADETEAISAFEP